jgi:GH25 family lysozyme M1 (1,4-beta-N-acetylmuramidase)
MARRSKKGDKKLLLRWIIALGIILLVMTALAIFLKNRPTPTSPPSTTPTLEPNPYGPADFGYTEDGYLTCLSGESIPGIDVSSHQGTIDWPKVKAAGIEFAFIRVGYRGYDTGTLHADQMALTNLHQAKAAGLKIGAYFFSQALNETEAVEEASFALAMLEGITLDLPLVYDWEYVSESARTGAMKPDTLLACVEAFCAQVEQAGFSPMVYFNRELSSTLLDLIQVSRYPFWLAMYTDQMDFPYKVDFWQYSDKGNVPGIDGDVDLDLYFP